MIFIGENIFINLNSKYSMYLFELSNDTYNRELAVPFIFHKVVDCLTDVVKDLDMPLKKTFRF